MVYFVFLILIAILQSSTLPHGQKTASDLILHHGKIFTLDQSAPIAEAIVVKNGKIISIGTNEKIAAYSGEATTVIDLAGKTVLPGLIESHAHYLNLGYMQMKLKLAAAESWDEVVQMVATAASEASPGSWIRGRGWHQEKWKNLPEKLIEGYPLHFMLSTVAPENPVYLEHASGHGIIVNEAAMRFAGITKETADPPGGRILHDNDGLLTGIFLENAEDLIYLPMTSYLQNRDSVTIRKEKEKAFEHAAQVCLQNGITTFHDAGVKFENIEFYKQMIDAKRSPLRLWVMIGDTITLLREKLSAYKIRDYGEYHLTVRAIKQYMDGALGSHGAWLLEPYADLPNQIGSNTTPLDLFEEIAELGFQNNFQVCTHAIGDRANRETLDIYERILKKSSGHTDRRWRIEHAQHLHPEDLHRFAKLGIIAAMQTNHCISDGPWVPKRLGEKRSEQGAYLWQSLIRSGAVVCDGTDAPVEDINPFLNIYAAVTRRMNNGKQFYPQQCMTREQALRAYTVHGAYAGFEENLKGMLAPGMLADMIVLSQDILTVPVEDIPETEVLYTIIGGKIVYQKN